MAFDAISERVAQMGESFRGFFRPEELVEDLKNIWLPSRRESHDRPDERDIFSVSPGRFAGPRPSRWPDLDYDVRVIRLSGMSLDPDSRIPILRRLRDSAAAWFAGKLAILNVGGRVRAVIKDEGLQGPRKRAKPQAGRGGAFSQERTYSMTTRTMTRRLGNKSLENIIRTDERYGHDGLWLGPRGRDYGLLLENPKPYQHANLYPDANSTYWFATLELPHGSVLTLRGRYPYARYFQFALYRPDPLGNFTATSEAFVDHEIKPDKGCVNPYEPGTHRLGDQRSYTIWIAAKNAPGGKKNREPNTLYCGTGGSVQIVYRVYLPDVGRDGSGDVGLPTYEVRLANGMRLSPEQVRKKLNRPLTKGIPAGMSVEKWRALCNAPDNDPTLKPETTPARNPPVVERYFNNQYNLVGVFKPPKVRAKIPTKVETGFGGDPVTLFMMAWVSRRFGSVLVIRGKMPRFPDTFMGKNGKGLETMTDWQCRYWSVIMSEAPPSGLGGDALADMQVPLDKDSNYTIVVSRLKDRPANATEQNGIAWLDWGTRGEGIGDKQSRADFGLLLFRFMYNNPRWKQSPDKISVPGTEAEVMGPYLPRCKYTDKASFEAAKPPDAE